MYNNPTEFGSMNDPSGGFGRRRNLQPTWKGEFPTEESKHEGHEGYGEFSDWPSSESNEIDLFLKNMMEEAKHNMMH
jgi:hypothetical protein